MNELSCLGHRNQNAVSSAELKTVPWSQCQTTFLDYNKSLRLALFQDGINAGQYCAKDSNVGRSRCKGDRGGPLQMFNDTDVAYIVGVVSFDLRRGSVLPALYTRVAYYTDWIASHVWPDALGSI